MLVNNVRAYKELLAKTSGKTTQSVKRKYGFKIDDLIVDL
jgi:hypothetical protein